MANGYIYILHFDHPLYHAEHYAGCSISPRQRLDTHALIGGSKITRHLLKNGYEWTLGALMVCNRKRMREIERNLKNQHHTKRYCELCQPLALRFTGTTPIARGLLNFAYTSREIKACGKPMTEIYLDNNSQGSMTTLEILELMTSEKESLGFIPCGGEQGLTYLQLRSQIVVAREIATAKVIGYLAYTKRLSDDQIDLKIQQCVVRDDYRFRGIGRRMIDYLFDTVNPFCVSCKVRSDLTANDFWINNGFLRVGQEQHETSGSLLNKYLLTKEAHQWHITKSKTSEPIDSTTTANGPCSPTSPPPSARN